MKPVKETHGEIRVIEVQLSAKAWGAKFKGDDDSKFFYGMTRLEAIGNLIFHHQQDFAITFEGDI